MSELVLLKWLTFAGFIFASGFFSSAETAFTAISQVKLRSLIDEKVKGHEKLTVLLKKPKHLITCILIGNNIANVAASAMATVVMMDTLTSMGITKAASLSVITGGLTLILLTFGEITPKTIAIKNPSKLALKIAPIIYVLFIVFYPIISLFVGLSGLISKLFGISTDDMQKLLTEEEIKAIIKMGEEEGILEKEEKNMIHGVFNVSEKIVREIMTPRTDCVCIANTATINDVIQLISEKGHSRIPVYEDKIDNITGVIYAKDLLTISTENRQNHLQKFCREAVFIPETKNIEELLQQMRLSKFHMALVVDEHGGLAGLATFEDIIEEIVGEVQDEYDTEESELTTVSHNHYIVDASMSIDDLGEKIDIEFPEDDDDYDTVGGFVLSQLGSFPKKGEQLTYKNLTITVKEIKKRRIINVEIIATTQPISN